MLETNRYRFVLLFLYICTITFGILLCSNSVLIAYESDIRSRITEDTKSSDIELTVSAIQSKNKLRVFFIGNSHTSCNNLTEVIQRLAPKIEPDVDLTTVGHTLDGYTLERHWNDGKALTKMMKGRWDVVVLQENGRIPLVNPDGMRKYALMFDKEIKKISAKTVLYMTTAYQDRPETIKTISKTYMEIAKELEAEIVPIGIAFENSLKKRPDLILHNLPDTVHANQRGTYLTASVFLATLTGKRPLGLSRGGLTELTDEEIVFLQDISWETYVEYRKKIDLLP